MLLSSIYYNGIVNRYSQRGVSSSKKDVHDAIKNVSKGLNPKSFCKIIPDYLGGNKEQYCNIMHADGAGTKSALAYMYWKETGDLSVWRGIAHDSVIMNVDDLLCVGAIDNIILSSTIGRNKHLIPKEVLSELIHGTEDTLKMLNTFGINIFSSGGETADLGDIVKTVLVDSTVSCRMKLSKVISTDKIQHNDVIVGLCSYGQADYEDTYNSGIGSNGLSSARHDVLSKIYLKKYPETYDILTPSELIYCGKNTLHDNYLNNTKSIGELLLSPTRTYAPIIKELIECMFDDIHGIIHCTGGGQTKILNFVDNFHIVKENLFEVPLIMKIIQKNSDTDWYEMYKVFNMGHRMEIYLDERKAQKVIDISKSYGVDAQIIGYVKKNDIPQLSITSKYGSFEYFN